jgi:predicted aspartyl protease
MNAIPRRKARRAACAFALMLLLLCLQGCASFAPKKTLLPGGHVEFPVDTDLISPLVQVKVNGEGPYTFVLDTGASALVVSDWLAAKLKLPMKSSPYRLDDPKGRRSDARPLARVKTIQIGTATFSDIRAVVDPLNHPWAAPRVAGVIGCAVLSNCCLTVDLTDQTAWLDAQSLDPAAGIPIELTEMVPRIPIMIDPAGEHQTEVMVQLDTGYGGSLSLPKSIQAQVGELRPEGEALAWTIGGTDTERQYYAPATFIVAGQVLRGIHGIGLTPANEGRIGAALLRKFIISIDWRTRCAQFRTHPATTRP